MKPYEGQVYLPRKLYTSERIQPVPEIKKPLPLRKKMGKKELAYTAMLEDLYQRAEKVKPGELDAFIAEVIEKLPGYEKGVMTKKVRDQRYENGMHASALAGIAAMASVSFETPGYRISENQASVITHLVHNGFYGRHAYVARVR